MLSSLEVALVLLAASVLAVIALRALSLPPLVAYLAVGVLLGPHAIGMSGQQDAVRHAGELGVVFLMFSIGLEFNLAKLSAMRRLVFGLGGAQVSVTILAVMASSRPTARTRASHSASCCSRISRSRRSWRSRLRSARPAPC